MSAGNAQPHVSIAHERGLAAFLEPDQARRVDALLGSAKGRPKAIAILAHGLRLVTKTASRIQPNEQNAATTLAHLKRAGAGTTCYVMSEHQDWDGSVMPLSDALTYVIGAGYGTFLSCVAGKLGYYESEIPGERYILAALK